MNQANQYRWIAKRSYANPLSRPIKGKEGAYSGPRKARCDFAGPIVMCVISSTSRIWTTKKPHINGADRASKLFGQTDHLPT
jgi:hypothetical protein